MLKTLRREEVGWGRQAQRAALSSIGPFCPWSNHLFSCCLSPLCFFPFLCFLRGSEFLSLTSFFLPPDNVMVTTCDIHTGSLSELYTDYHDDCAYGIWDTGALGMEMWGHSAFGHMGITCRPQRTCVRCRGVRVCEEWWSFYINGPWSQSHEKVLLVLVRSQPSEAQCLGNRRIVEQDLRPWWVWISWGAKALQCI